MTNAAGPLGVFDSGVGGLTVVCALLRRFPQERVLYVADQAHVPYGDRPLDEVRGFATAISAFLASQGCRAIIMACNISSATAQPSVAARLAPLPVLGVIAPAVRRALRERHSLPGLPNRPIGVLATEGTVRSRAYTQQMQRLDPEQRVVEVACPRFVPLVESGCMETEAAYAAASTYLEPLAGHGCRTIILGCTHYPFLLPTLRRVASALFDHPVTFIDPAEEMAAALSAVLPDVGQRQFDAPNLLLTTGSLEVFAAQAPRFLPGIDSTVAAADWHAGGRLQRRNALVFRNALASPTGARTDCGA